MQPNSEKFGIFNKRTHILSSVSDPTPTFKDVDSAKNWFFTQEALDVHDDTCAKLEWTLIENNRLKYTMAWTTNGDPKVRPEDDFAGIYDSQKRELTQKERWSNNHYHTEVSSDHLF